MYFADDTESHQRTERLGDRLSPGIGERTSPELVKGYAPEFAE